MINPGSVFSINSSFPNIKCSTVSNEKSCRVNSFAFSEIIFLKLIRFVRNYTITFILRNLINCILKLIDLHKQHLTRSEDFFCFKIFYYTIKMKK